ncbi:hypothetical protein Vadar_023141 [Vaccinium darrowii]|uniref:Uncharacterized protein n=1 Tax=Vaccinium darrowii TaxID=229202 RepID=A0ACB7YNT4_9ERIC|nr:hypothetical protein Vadar_023141 [Vaccinium darrowii]
MTLEEIRGSNVSKNDRFPVGMRVLAVDDDQVCLKLLDDLLRKCQYHGPRWGIVDGEFEFEFDASSFKSCL